MAANPVSILILNTNMLATFHSLSQELVDEVVSCLQDDKASLLAFSLTCRSLVPGCQRALFLNLAVGFLGPSERATVTNIPTIQHFLTMMETIPHIAAYTKNLNLALGFLEEDLEERLVTQLASFPHLTRFSLHLTENPVSYLFISSKVISSIQNVLRLRILRTLEHLQFVNVPAYILPENTSVKSLVVRFYDFESDNKSTHRVLARFGAQPRMALPRSDEESSMAIDLLDLNHNQFSSGVNYALDNPTTLDFSKLKQLQIDIEDIKHFYERQINQVLQVCSSIRVLRLVASRYTYELGEEDEEDDDPEFVDLSPLGSLRVLSIRLHKILDDEIWTPFPWLFRLLGTLPRINSLEEITLHIRHMRSDDFTCVSIDRLKACIPWGTFGPFLTKRFPRLRRLKLLLQSETMSILKKIIDTEHPEAIELKKRGLLKIEDWDANVDSWEARPAGLVKSWDSF